ncbi:MAG: isocitrate dehydrogenase (NADP(+)) [Desulfomonile sp.]|nr:isocitrate dehydrogenase (NADP(+)) [Deltaproteobacteria bacterium]
MNRAFLDPTLRGQWITIDSTQKLNVPDKPVVGFIEGDGVGSDIWSAAKPVFDAAVHNVSAGARALAWWEIPAGEKSFRETGEYLPESSLQAIRKAKVVLKGPLTTPVGGGFRSLNVTLRKELDLFACIRPIQYIPGTPSPLLRPEDVDMVLFRENTEDVYAGIEWSSGSEGAAKVIRFLEDDMGVHLDPASGVGIKPMSPHATKRLVRRAIHFAIQNGRDRVTLVHKGNIMKFTEGAFRDWGYELAKEEFPDVVITENQLRDDYGDVIPNGKILLNDRIADAMFQQVLLRPRDYQVLALPNLNGDYLSDALAAQVGGLGMAPGSNEGDVCAVFEATHGSAPKYAGLDKINPSSLLLSGVMMFRHMGWNDVADLIVYAVSAVIRSGIVTYDLARLMSGAREVSCSGFAKAVIERMNSEQVA